MGRASPQRIVWRCLVVGLTAVLASFSFAHAVTHIVRDSNAEAALQFSPRDAVALSVAAEAALATAKSSALVSPETRALILSSLSVQAINPRALRQLGFVADAAGDIGKARQLITLAERTSRREFGTQLWLIEDGIRSNDMRATLRHYDTALRVGYDNGSILYPILINALDDSEIQAAFVPYIRQAPPWLGIFLSQAISQAQNPAALAQTIMRAGTLPAGDSYRDFERQLLGQLAAKQQYDAAVRFYRSLDGVDRSVPTSMRLGGDATDARFAPISWQLQNAPGVGGSFDGEATADAQRLSIYAGSGERGIIMSKLLFLAPGRYVVSQQLSDISMRDGASIDWEVNCLRQSGQDRIWRATLPVRPGRFVLPPVTVSSDCPVQSVVLLMAGGSRQEGGQAVLSRIDLRPLGQ